MECSLGQVAQTILPFKNPLTHDIDVEIILLEKADDDHTRGRRIKHYLGKMCLIYASFTSTFLFKPNSKREQEQPCVYLLRC